MTKLQSSTATGNKSDIVQLFRGGGGPMTDDSIPANVSQTYCSGGYSYYGYYVEEGLYPK